MEQDGLVIQDISSEDDGTYICRAKVPDEGELAERRIQVEVRIYVHSRQYPLSVYRSTRVSDNERSAFCNV